jgi:hypothetical protein
MENVCICCGEIIPEGYQVCPICERRAFAPDAVLEDGTHLYLKTSRKPSWPNLQLFLYDLLNRRGTL